MIVFVLFPRQDVIASSRTSCPLSKTAVPVFQPDRQMKHQIPAEGQPSRSIKNMRLKQFLTALGRLRKDLLNFHFRSDKNPTLGFFNIHSFAKHQKIEGGTLWGSFFEKNLTLSKKTEKGDL